MSMNQDEDDKPIIYWGDVGFVVVMSMVGLFTIGLIVALMLGFHPYAALFPQSDSSTQPPAAQAQPSQPGEVNIGIAPKKPK